VNKSFKIVLYESSPHSTFYSIQFSDEDKCGFDKFLADPSTKQPEFKQFVYHLSKIEKRAITLMVCQLYVWENYDYTVAGWVK